MLDTISSALGLMYNQNTSRYLSPLSTAKPRCICEVAGNIRAEPVSSGSTVPSPKNSVPPPTYSPVFNGITTVKSALAS